MDTFPCIAFFTDWMHPLHPMTSGVRLCLVYNLAASPEVATPTYDLSMTAEMQLRSIVEDWKADERVPSTLGNSLSHQYTPKSFCISTLKGRDVVVFRRLIHARKLNGEPLFHISLVLMKGYIELQDDQVYFDRGYYNLEDEDLDIPFRSWPRLVVDGRSGRQVNDEDWCMLCRDDGWWIPFDEHYDDEDDDEDTDEDERDENYKRKMFRDVDPERVLVGHMGNEGATETLTYYAAGRKVKALVRQRRTMIKVSLWTMTIEPRRIRV
jgi:hypothetical protein